MDGHAIAVNFDLKNLSLDFYDDPFPVYRALREHAPVKRMADGSLFLTRYADIQSIYLDAGTFSSDKKKEFAPKYGEASHLFRHHTTTLVFNDAPLHTRLRRSIVGAMTPRALSRLEPKLEHLVARLLDRAEERGQIDAIADFAAAIPVEVIGDLLSIPDADRAPLRGWSLAILGALEPVLTAEVRARGEDALAGFHEYLSELIADRRKHPVDPTYDVLTRLLQIEGEPLSGAELAENCVFLLNAGHETTTNLIGNAIELFCRCPAERAKLTAQPDLLRSAIEEVLRYESSNQLGNRITTRGTNIAGEAIDAGTPATLCIGAANRDPAAFENPEIFDIARNPNKHLAFAAGPHQCAGMNLARLEARIALAGFLRRFPRYALAGRPTRGLRARFRGFVALPLSLHH